MVKEPSLELNGSKIDKCVQRCNTIALMVFIKHHWATFGNPQNTQLECKFTFPVFLSLFVLEDMENTPVLWFIF